MGRRSPMDGVLGSSLELGRVQRPAEGSPQLRDFRFPRKFLAQAGGDSDARLHSKRHAQEASGLAAARHQEPRDRKCDHGKPC